MFVTHHPPPETPVLQASDPVPVIEVRTRISTSAEQAFDRMLDVAAHVRDMAGSKDRLLSPIPDGGVLRLGDEVTWLSHHHRVGFTTTSQVVEYDRPFRFVDLQLRGPLRAFRHEHLFIPIDNDIEMIDMVSYTARGGPIGRIIERWVLTSYIRELLEDRGAHLKKVVEAQPARNSGFAMFDERDIA